MKRDFYMKKTWVDLAPKSSLIRASDVLAKWMIPHCGIWNLTIKKNRITFKFRDSTYGWLFSYASSRRKIFPLHPISREFSNTLWYVSSNIDVQKYTLKIRHISNKWTVLIFDINRRNCTYRKNHENDHKKNK